jgi:ribonuclease G
VAIAGRHLVLTPWSKRVGVSRRIDVDRERRRLRQIVDRLRPRDLGFIIRTAGDASSEPDLEADIKYLTSVWDDIQLHRDEARAPSVLYSEPELPLRVIRDFANLDTKRIVVDSPEVYRKMVAFVERFVADPRPRIEQYRDQDPIFDHFGLESQIDANLGRKVWLKSGGYLIVDQSEALTAIDVNTGRYVGKRDLEETVLKTNMEAVREVVHHLRLRNIGGLIIIDLIDMESSENREKVYRALQEALRHDKARTNLLKISELGLIQMTRKRTRESLVRTLCDPCPYCEGGGYVLSSESVTYKILREMRKDLPRFCGRRLAVAVNPRVAELLLGAERAALAGLEAELGREIEVRARPGLHQEQFEIEALDAGPPVALELPWLSPTHPEASPQSAPEPAGSEEEGKLAETPTPLVALAEAGAAAAEADVPVPEADTGATVPPETAVEPQGGDGEEGEARLGFAAPPEPAEPDPPTAANGSAPRALDAGSSSRILPPSHKGEKP